MQRHGGADEGTVKKLRRLIRYLIEAPRVVTEYKFQGDVREMVVFSGSNWAGCRRTTRSTSGEVMMRGTHFLKSWSRTQKNVTLSSAEAELLAAVKGSGEALGMLQLMSSVGVPMTALHHGGLVCSTGSSGQEGKWQIASCQSGTSLGATGRRLTGA